MRALTTGSAGRGSAGFRASNRGEAPTPSVPSPSLSVLVTAWRRRDFLGEALRSVERQTLPREEFEVVVVRDFEDPSTDRQIASLDACDIRFGSDNLGRTMALGVRACRGEVICFLDDDDRFDPRKLAVVRAEFRRQRDLGYFHNGLSLMDEAGRRLDGEDPVLTSRALAMSRDWDFCMSCISVRRELVLPLLDRWPGVPKAPDSFLDYISRASHYTRRQTLDPLTEYRLHPRSSSRRTNHAPALLSTARILRSFPRSRARDGAISSLLGRYMSEALRGRSSDRGSALWAVLHLVASGAPAEFRPDAREVLCGALIPLSPRAAQRLYAVLRKGDVDWLPEAVSPGPSPSGAPGNPERLCALDEALAVFPQIVDEPTRIPPRPPGRDDFDGFATDTRAPEGPEDEVEPDLRSRPT